MVFLVCVKVFLAVTLLNLNCRIVNMDFDKSLRELRKLQNMNQSELARAIGVTPQTIQQWEAGITAPSRNNQEKAARVLGVSKRDLMFGGWVNENAEKYSNVSTIRPSNVVKVDHLSSCAGMGAIVPFNTNTDSVLTTVEITKKYINDNLGSVSNPDNLKIIGGFGDSMTGVFESGDTIFVDTGIDRFVSESTYVVSYDDSIWIKKVQRDGDGGFILKSTEASGYDPIRVPKKRLGEFQVIGLVLGVMHFNKLI